MYNSCKIPIIVVEERTLSWSSAISYLSFRPNSPKMSHVVLENYLKVSWSPLLHINIKEEIEGPCKLCTSCSSENLKITGPASPVFLQAIDHNHGFPATAPAEDKPVPHSQLHRISNVHFVCLLSLESSKVTWIYLITGETRIIIRTYALLSLKK